MFKREVYTEIEIEAQPEQVWQVLTDFTAYQLWNIFISEIRGMLKVGERLKVSAQVPVIGKITFRPVLIRVEPGQELRWLAHSLIPGLLDSEHVYEIVRLSTKRVRFVQKEILSGLMVPLFMLAMASSNRRSFEVMNSALKRRVLQVAEDREGQAAAKD